MPPKFHDRAVVYPAVYAALRQQDGGSSQRQTTSYERPVLAESQGAATAVEITAREVRCCFKDCSCSRELPCQTLSSIASIPRWQCARTLSSGGDPQR